MLFKRYCLHSHRFLPMCIQFFNADTHRSFDLPTNCILCFSRKSQSIKLRGARPPLNYIQPKANQYMYKKTFLICKYDNNDEGVNSRNNDGKPGSSYRRTACTLTLYIYSPNRHQARPCHTSLLRPIGLVKSMTWDCSMQVLRGFAGATVNYGPVNYNTSKHKNAIIRQLL